MISFAEQASHIWEIPFPAVMICPTIKGHSHNFDYKETIDHLLENGPNNLTSDECVNVKSMIDLILFFSSSLYFLQ